MWKRLLIAPLLLLLLWACGTSAEDHRRALEERGITWDEEAFVDHAKQGEFAANPPLFEARILICTAVHRKGGDATLLTSRRARSRELVIYPG